ncbi:RidA family protein [Mycolicibacterium smegmatis]|uniref:RidA family protein n=1 Tax=Mycolicibacterium smegmatis TaxID=1772 RepID=UPI0005D86F31|nr:RidA family protein [Mycolicibacterium smegmatis]MDF1897771.1 RidA family protein [Mycolicibacterium smegmatis]MDF1904327.1 RidA family protein [Mycolicibacterium smegmatis]MDF1917698.1 RidA family protein [Mycolicibacterium smegmatis]MDF1923055.1 RidA family protein [Mycolicibacterium smegmatis]UAK58178.1 RidA family protein [Mycolicibacterium smegmatis]
MSNKQTGAQSVEALLDARVVVTDGLVFVSGLSAADPGVGIPPQAAVSPEFPYYGADIQKQTTYLLEKLQQLLAEAGTSLEKVVKTQVFIADCRLFDAFDQVWKRFFPVPPPRTTVGVGAEEMPVPGALVVVDVIAAADGVTVTHVDSPTLPKPLANYTPCVAAGDWLFLAGQLPTEFGDTGLAPAATVSPHFPHHVSALTAQAEFTIGICETLLSDAGSDWDNTVRVHVFLKNMADAPLFDELWREKFDGNPPPYLIVGVEELLTGGAQVEIDVIAVRAGTSQPATRFAVVDVEIGQEGYRPFEVRDAVRAAFDAAIAQPGAVEPVKVHAFLPAPADIYGFGRGLPSTFTERAAITTSTSVGGTRAALEIVYRVEA